MIEPRNTPALSAWVKRGPSCPALRRYLSVGVVTHRRRWFALPAQNAFFRSSSTTPTWRRYPRVITLTEDWALFDLFLIHFIYLLLYSSIFYYLYAHLCIVICFYFIIHSLLICKRFLHLSTSPFFSFPRCTLRSIAAISFTVNRIGSIVQCGGGLQTNGTPSAGGPLSCGVISVSLRFSISANDAPRQASTPFLIWRPS